MKIGGFYKKTNISRRRDAAATINTFLESRDTDASNAANPMQIQDFLWILWHLKDIPKKEEKVSKVEPFT